jgi:hypothetical protein
LVSNINYCFCDISERLVKSSDFKPIYDGEVGSYVPAIFEFANNVQGVGVENSTGFRLNPDRYHSPSIQLYGDLWRSDFAKFDFIQMYIRCSSKSEITLHFGHWTATGVGGSSKTMNLTNFIFPQPSTHVDYFNASWSYVRAPITNFFTSDWSLNGVERIYFNKDIHNRHCVVDNIALIRFNKTSANTCIILINS